MSVESLAFALTNQISTVRSSTAPTNLNGTNLNLQTYTFLPEAEINTSDLGVIGKSNIYTDITFTNGSSLPSILSSSNIITGVYLFTQAVTNDNYIFSVIRIPGISPSSPTFSVGSMLVSGMYSSVIFTHPNDPKLYGGNVISNKLTYYTNTNLSNIVELSMSVSGSNVNTIYKFSLFNNILTPVNTSYYLTNTHYYNDGKSHKLSPGQLFFCDDVPNILRIVNTSNAFKTI